MCNCLGPVFLGVLGDEETNCYRDSLIRSLRLTISLRMVSRGSGKFSSYDFVLAAHESLDELGIPITNNGALYALITQIIGLGDCCRPLSACLRIFTGYDVDCLRSMTSLAQEGVVSLASFRQVGDNVYADYFE